MNVSTVYYIGGPRDGLREALPHGPSGYAIKVAELATLHNIGKIEDGTLLDGTVRQHTYHLRQVGRDRFGDDVYVAVLEDIERGGF